ncbi:MAG: type II toxin-antitoxin system VapB family antitoxin [Cyclobacteriaceae bacterium]
MRTTIDLPDDLIKEAMEVTGAKTKSQLIKDALVDKILKVKKQRLISIRGKIDLSLRGRIK